MDAADIIPSRLYSKAALADALGVSTKTIHRWSQQPSDELPPPIYQKGRAYWLGSALLRFFERKQETAVEAVTI